MYEFIQISTGWLVHWGPPLPAAEIVEKSEMTDAAECTEFPSEVLVRRRAADRRQARRGSMRRGLVAVR